MTATVGRSLRASERWVIPERYKVFIQQGMVLLVVVLLAVFFTIMKPNFATWSNISSLLLASVVTGVQAIGLSFVIATGGIDLTPGLGMAATSVFAAILIADSGLGLPIWVGILGGVGGWCATRIDQWLARGLCQDATDDRYIGDDDGVLGNGFGARRWPDRVVAFGSRL